MDKMRDTLSKAIPWLAEYLRHLRAKNDPKALSLTNDLAEVWAALSSPHPEAREEAKELAGKIFDGIALRVDQFFKAKNIQGGVRCGDDMFSIVDKIELAKSIEAYALSRLAAQKDEGLRKAVERVVPYVMATLAVKNSVAVPGNREWRGVHAGRADSSIRQLEGLLAALREPDGRKG